MQVSNTSSDTATHTNEELSRSTTNYECAGKADVDMKVRVLRHQSRSGQVETESCGRVGNAVFEA